MVSEELGELTGEERHQIYRMLRLRVRVLFDDTIEVEGILNEAISTPMDTRSSTPGATGATSKPSGSMGP